MKKIIYALGISLLSIGCRVSNDQKPNEDSLSDSLESKFESKTTTCVVTNLDTMYRYYNSRHSDFYISEIPFKGKKYTILFSSGSPNDFKLINVDTIDINPIFKPEN